MTLAREFEIAIAISNSLVLHLLPVLAQAGAGQLWPLPCAPLDLLSSLDGFPRLIGILYLDLGKQTQRNVGCFRLHSHALRVETRSWEHHDGTCGKCDNSRRKTRYFPVSLHANVFEHICRSLLI